MPCAHILTAAFWRGIGCFPMIPAISIANYGPSSCQLRKRSIMGAAMPCSGQIAVAVPTLSPPMSPTCWKIYRPGDLTSSTGFVRFKKLRTQLRWNFTSCSEIATSLNSQNIPSKFKRRYPAWRLWAFKFTCFLVDILCIFARVPNRQR